jgi:hypothetical protein
MSDASVTHDRVRDRVTEMLAGYSKPEDAQ